MSIRSKPTNLNAASNWPFLKQTGVLPPEAVDKIGHDRDNNSPITWASADGLTAFSGINYDASGRLIIGTSANRSTPRIVRFVMNANAGILDQCFWISDGVYEVVSAIEIHSTAGNDAGAVTLDVTKESSGIAPSAGISVLASPFNAKATANTYQTKAPASLASTVAIAVGDRLSLNVTGVTTALAGVVLEISLAPGYTGPQASFVMNANAGLIDQCFYTATKTVKITRIDCVFSLAATDVGAINLQVTKDVSTNAPGAGTDLLTNNTNAGFDLKAAPNVVQNGTLSATAANLILVPGDRLSVDFSAAPTTTTGVVIVVTFETLYRTIDVSWNIATNASLADGSIFIANRPYRLLSATEVHATAGTDGSAVNMQVTIDRATDAPGAGSDLLSNNASAGFDMKGTANTPQVGTFANTGLNYMYLGDRVSVDFAGVLTTLAGVELTLTLEEA